jgi:hypothetical protein
VQLGGRQRILALALLPSCEPGDILHEGGLDMYIARFSYSVLPVDRQRAIDCIHREMEAAARIPLKARLLIPLTRAQGGAALQFEVELESLEQFDQFRERGMGDDTAKWMQTFSEILTAPPAVELLRVQDS